MGSNLSAFRTAFVRGTAALMIVVAVSRFAPVSAAPADIFGQVAAPALGSDPPKAADLRAGDASVSTQTGALQYAYPIKVPPGRLGAAPSLALQYSSQAPVYGGIAAGWSLPLGLIRDDTSRAWLPTRSPEYGTDKTDDRFSVNESRLVSVDEPHASDVYKTYRIANGDSSFTRYERCVVVTGCFSDQVAGVNARWRARRMDGSTHFYGETSLAPGCVIADGFAPLTRSIDAFGNEVRYQWQAGTAGECRIDKITWGQNVGAGMSAPFAQVVFAYDSALACGAADFYIGAQVDYRSNSRVVTGASRLLTITATAFDPSTPGMPDHTRTITLGYAATSCSNSYAPVRLLTSLQESASGTDSPLVTLPAVTFTYGDPTVALTNVDGTAAPWVDPPNGDGNVRPNNLSWGYRRDAGDDRAPSIEAMMVDIDGDGLLDRLVNVSTPNANGTCTARWQKNLGPSGIGATMPTFSGSVPITLPHLRWRGLVADPSFKESCSLNGQYTAFENSTFMTQCHNNTACAAGPSGNPGPFCYPGGTECPPGDGGGPLNTPFRTYLAYRWIDMDGDGLTDLVTAVHGDIDHFDIARDIVPGPETPVGPFGAWPACPTQQDHCLDINSACAAPNFTCPGENQLCTTNWAGLNACLASAPAIGCSELTESPFMAPGPETPTTKLFREPYMRCEGLYPWFIYKNQGNGVFATTPIIKYQPIQLESDSPDSNFTGATIASLNHALLDFDGDGILDAVVRPNDDDKDPNGLWNWWHVWLGDGTGGFDPKMHMFVGRRRNGPSVWEHNDVSRSGATQPGPAGTVTGSHGLLDVNGDGVPDHWVRDMSGNTTNIAFHGGTEIRRYSGSYGELSLPLGRHLSSNVATSITNPPSWTPGQPILEGSTQTLERPVDVDHDGRVDLVRIDSVGRPLVNFNVGGTFSTTTVTYPGYPGSQGGLMRNTRAQFLTPLVWELGGDLLDLDGDGLADSISTTVSTFERRRSSTTPPRLLQAIHNGRGGHVSIGYSQMHDRDGVPIVEQHPDQTWSDGRPKATPRTQWVVKSLTATDDFAATTSITSYRYRNPRHGADDEGYFGFRGFEEVITTSPSLAKTYQRYEYDVDWSGRLGQTLVAPAEAPNDRRSIAKSKWTSRTLFGGAVTSYFATIAETFTCANGQDETACLAAAPAYSRSASTLVDFPLIGQKLLILETGTLVQKQLVNADGDRQTIKTFDIAADTTTYRVRPRTITKEHRVGGLMTMFGKSDQTWDPTLRAKLTEEVWFDAVDTNRAKSNFVYDMTTGNVIQRWKPVQYDAGTTKTQFTYDARKLFVAVEVNELGHQRDNFWEYGTGTKLRTEGPNCAQCTTTPIKEKTKIRIDGLGRTIEFWETVTDTGTSFPLVLKEETSFVDTVVVPTTPASVTQKVRLTTAAAPRTETKTELDGHGRPKKKTEYVQGTAPVDAITTWQYRNDGTLQSVSVPDPSANSATVVTYGYGFDSLGRPTSIRRPDAIPALQQSGVDINYDGLTKTVTEFVGVAGGLRAMTKSVTDAFGRLIEVHEKTADNPLTFAVTHYTFGADDRVSTIVDPGNVTTQLFHDFAGRRTQITRHGRTWKYTYNKNSNLIAELVPGSPNPPITDPNYTTTIAYDDLDRPLSKLVGQRGLSTQDQTLFAGRTETFTWDAPGGGTSTSNLRGRLRSWKTFAPNAGTPTITRNRLSDDQGADTRAEHVYANLVGFSNTVFTTMKHNVAGMLTEIRFSEGLASANSVATIEHTARGFPLQMIYDDPVIAPQTIGVQQRNVAGLVTSRETALATTNHFARSQWTYDKLGRVTSQFVKKGLNGQVLVASQELNYFGNDNPSGMAHTLGASSTELLYGYDTRHQIIAADETSGSDYLTSSYQYGTGGRFTNVNIAQPTVPFGSEVKPRNVNYQYSDPDPERVTALLNVSTGLPYATYQYDAAGNQTSRCYGATVAPCAGESMEFVYDGKDQLRRVTKKQAGVVVGSEEYWYDDTGQRTTIVNRDANGTKSGRVQFLGGMEVHFNQADVRTHANLHLSLGTPVARVKRTTSTTTLEYMFHGLTNNTLASISSTGTTNAAFSYSPFGEVVEVLDGGGAMGVASHRRRFNDKYDDDLSDLSYYGARYYDKVSMSWTQGDPLYRYAPDLAGSRPRRGNLYQFSLNNPLRYIDPDGREATDYNKLYNDATWQARRSGGGEVGAVEAGVKTLISALGIDTGNATIKVVSDIRSHVPKGVKMMPGVRAFALGTNVYIDAGAVHFGVTGIFLASIIVHESEHVKRGGARGAEPVEGGLKYAVSEFYAIRAERDFWNQKNKEEKISPEQYKEAMERVKFAAKAEGVDGDGYYDIAGIVARLDAGAHWAQAVMPENFAHVSLASDVYRSKSPLPRQTLWGLQIPGLVGPR